MSLSRRNPRRDAIEDDIITFLRAAGWSVAQWSGRNNPDLVLSKWGRTVLAEVKTGNAKLTPGQEAWHRAWTGSDVVILRSVQDALALNDAVVRGEAYP